MSSKASLCDELANDFIDQGIVQNPTPCNFRDSDINRMRSSDSFPSSAVFRMYDPFSRSDFSSKNWVCFPEYPFLIGLRYPFPSLITEFFHQTGLCYAQLMPMAWRILFVIQNMIDFHSVDFSVSELSLSYSLRSYGSGYYLFQINSNRVPLVLRVTQNDLAWKGRFFYVKRDSLPNGSLLPFSWITKGRISSLPIFNIQLHPNTNTLLISVSFSKIVPASKDSAEKVQEFLKISKEERTFRIPLRSESTGSRETESAMSGSGKSSARFVSADLQLEHKKVPANTSKNRALVSGSKSKKRKSSHAIEVDDSPPCFQTIVNQCSQSLNHMTQMYNESQEVIEGMKKISAARSVIMNKETAKIANLKKELYDMKNEFRSLGEHHRQEMEQLIADVKKDATIAVLEARIQLAEQAREKGFDTSIWDLQLWKNKLATLTESDAVTLKNGSGKAIKAIENNAIDNASKE